MKAQNEKGLSKVAKESQVYDYMLFEYCEKTALFGQAVLLDKKRNIRSYVC